MKNTNTSKILMNSHKMVMQRLEKMIRGVISDAEDGDTKGFMTFENVGVVLHKLGVFQALEFLKQDLNQSSLSINKSKPKVQRLGQEVKNKGATQL